MPPLRLASRLLLFHGVELNYDRFDQHIGRVLGDRETLHVLNHPARYRLSIEETIERARVIEGDGLRRPAGSPFPSSTKPASPATQTRFIRPPRTGAPSAPSSSRGSTRRGAGPSRARRAGPRAIRAGGSRAVGGTAPRTRTW